jgi:hypothetical protein
MKKLKSSLTATMAVLLLVLVTSGFAAAQSDNVSFVRGFLTNTTTNADGNIHAGDTVQIAIFYHNNLTETVILDYAGVHFDWMPTDSLYGFNVSSYDVQVAGGQDYFFQQQINIKIPTTTNGNHSYYVGIDGHTSSAAVSLSSVPVEFIVIGSGATTAPTNTNSGSNNSGGITDIVLYVAIIAVVAIVVVLFVIVLIRRKRKPTSKPSEPATSQPTPSQPEEKSSEQDFAI